MLLGIMQYILSVHPADVRAVCIDAACLGLRIVVAAGTVAAVEEPSVLGKGHMLTAQATLDAGEGGELLLNHLWLGE